MQRRRNTVYSQCLQTVFNGMLYIQYAHWHQYGSSHLLSHSIRKPSSDASALNTSDAILIPCSGVNWATDAWNAGQGGEVVGHSSPPSPSAKRSSVLLLSLWESCEQDRNYSPLFRDGLAPTVRPPTQTQNDKARSSSASERPE